MAVIFGNDSILNLFVSLIIVISITLIFKTSTTTNFAQTTIATFGGYLVAKVNYESGLNIWLALAIGLAVCLLMGFIIDTFIIRRARMANPVSKQIITLGFTYILLAIILIFVQIREDTGELTQQPPATTLLPLQIRDTGGAGESYGFNIGGLFFYWNTLVCVGIALAIIILFFVVVYCTKFGLGVRMTASNETTAQMMGVNTHLITAVSWSFAAMLGCLACVFVNTLRGKLNTSIMAPVQLAAFLGCIVGGFSTFWGSSVAAVIIWLIGAILNYIGVKAPDILIWKDVIVYGIAMVFVLIRPSGLFGKAARKKV